MSKFLSTLGKISGAVVGVIASPIKAINTISETGDWGKGLKEAFIPGYAVYTGINDATNQSDQEIWEDIKDTDINGDGITLETDVLIAKEAIVTWIDEKTGIPSALEEIKENKKVSEEILNGSSDEVEIEKSRGFGGLALAGLVASVLLFI